MAWLEMSRSPEKRPNGWGVGECLWSPRRKSNGAKWGFWDTLLEIQPGDAVFHLCGQSGEASFTGVSTAATSCISIDEGPYGGEELYRVDLVNYAKFESPVLLSSVFESHGEFLQDYYSRNSKDRTERKERLFYVFQNHRLQCQNGAYLSLLSPTLLERIFGLLISSSPTSSKAIAPKAATGSTLIEAAARVGQQAFARNVKTNYGHRCAFPGCSVDDPRFLIGSHIARWADAEHLRGETSNGLCLCVLHDKAFEIGAFTVAPNYSIAANSNVNPGTWLSQALEPWVGMSLAKRTIPPSREALRHHWIAHGFSFDD